MMMLPEQYNKCEFILVKEVYNTHFIQVLYDCEMEGKYIEARIEYLFVCDDPTLTVDIYYPSGRKKTFTHRGTPYKYLGSVIKGIDFSKHKIAFEKILLAKLARAI